MKVSIETVYNHSYDDVIKSYPILTEEVIKQKLRLVSSLKWEEDAKGKYEWDENDIPYYYFENKAVMNISDMDGIKRLMQLVDSEIIIQKPNTIGTELLLVIYDDYIE